LSIPDLGSKNSNEKEGRTKFVDNFILEVVKKKVIELLTLKMINELSNFGLGSGDQTHPIPDPQHWEEKSGLQALLK
jgi:hypothetical protein